MSAELGHYLSEVARELGYLFWAENDQSNDKNDDDMGDAEHLRLCGRLSRAVFAS